MTFRKGLCLSSIAAASFFLAPPVQPQSKTVGNPAAVEARKRELRIAVLSPPEVSDQAEFLSATLSNAGFETLERADLSVVAREGALVSGNLPGELTSADFLVLTESVSVDEKPFLATRIVGRDDGQVYSADLRPLEEFQNGWAEALIPPLDTIATVGRQPKSDLPKVSIRTIREAFVAGKVENEVVGVALKRLLGVELARRADLRLLERNNLSLVQFERFLTIIDTDTFEPADYIITGTVRRETDKCSFELLVETRSVNSFAKLGAIVPSADLSDVAGSMADQFVSRFGSEKMIVPKTQVADGFKYDESARYVAEADRCVRLGLHESAAAFAETAYLLDTKESAAIAHLYGCTGLLASMPGMRGNRVDLSKSISPYKYSMGGNAFDFYGAMVEGSDSIETPLPGPEQWEALAVAAERAVEVDQRERLLTNSQTKNRFDPRLQILRGAVLVLTGDALSNLRRKHGPAVPPFELSILQRILEAERRLKGNTGNESGQRALLLGFHDTLYLAPSTEAAVDRIKERLYGPKVTALRRSREEDIGADWRAAELGRNDVYAFFNHAGYDPDGGDNSGVLVDETLLDFPFVAAAFGDGLPYKDAFESAVSSAPEEYRALARFDLLFSIAASEKAGEAREKAFHELRTELSKDQPKLKELGVLECCAYAFATLESSRKVTLGDQTGDYWMNIHRAVASDDAWISGNLSRKLIGYFDGTQWTSTLGPKPESYGRFLDSIEADLKGNRNPFSSRTRELALQELEKNREAFATDKAEFQDFAAKGALEGVPDEETLVLKASYWMRYPPVLATCVAEDGFYLLKHGDPEYDEDSSLVRFEIGGPIVEVKTPREIRDLVERSTDATSLSAVQRLGALEVGPNEIAIAFPGGTATFDRRTEAWSVRAEPFLENRSGMSFLGDYIASYIGVPVHSQAIVPVQGLYLTSRKTFQHVALVDTSRRPIESSLDNFKSLQFPFPPLAIDLDRFLAGIQSQDPIEAAWEGSLANGTPRLEAARQVSRLVPGFGASVTGTQRNGYINVVATRKPRTAQTVAGQEAKFEVGAFSIGPDGQTHWLLDTGTTSNRAASQNSADRWERRMLADDVNPLFSLPAKFQMHRGMSDAKPVLSYNGKRLLLLTGQITSDGRRLLYVWKDPDQKEPKRIALRFDGFEQYKPEERHSSNLMARYSVRSIFQIREYVCFEFDTGFFYIPESAL